MAQFDHWTKEPFSSNFRKMLTLEQYRDPKLAQLYHDYLATGSTKYMAAIFRKLTDSDDAAMQLALEFYGPMFLLYSVYDGANEKKALRRCCVHILTALSPRLNPITKTLCRRSMMLHDDGRRKRKYRTGYTTHCNQNWRVLLCCVRNAEKK